MADIFYVRKTIRVSIAAAGTYTLELDKQNQPFENTTLWAQAAAAGGNFDMTATLNGQAIATGAIAGVTTAIPQLIAVSGLFPQNAPGAVSVDGGALNGIVPGVKVTNNGASKAIFILNIVARSYGAAV